MPAARCLMSLMVVLVAAVCAAHAQERIKMCGRELIRLAVSSCGSSRIRRSMQHAPRWYQFSTEEYPASEAAHTASRPGREKDVFSLAAHLLSPRIRRAAGKISDICCEKGCSMKELIQFC